MEKTRWALVTGATGAIGRAIARAISAEPGWGVIVTARSEDKGRKLISELERATHDSSLRLEIVDVSRRESIGALASRIEHPLDVLVNNAAIAPRKREQTPDGIELQLATNVLGYQWMIAALEEQLARAGSARVVNVASYWAGDLDIDDLEFRKRRYDNNTAYRQSKQANRMLTVADAERLAPRKITVNACHPGDVSSTLSNSLGFGGSDSGDRAAETPVYLALSEKVRGVSGRYFEYQAEKTCRFASDRGEIEALRARCASYG